MLRLFVRRDFLYDIRKIVAGNGQDHTCDDFDDDGRGIRYGNRAVHIDDYGRVVPLPEKQRNSVGDKIP